MLLTVAGFFLRERVHVRAHAFDDRAQLRELLGRVAAVRVVALLRALVQFGVGLVGVRGGGRVLGIDCGGQLASRFLQLAHKRVVLALHLRH